MCQKCDKARDEYDVKEKAFWDKYVAQRTPFLEEYVAKKKTWDEYVAQRKPFLAEYWDKREPIWAEYEAQIEANHPEKKNWRI